MPRNAAECQPNRPRIPDNELILPFEATQVRGDYKEYLLAKRQNYLATIEGFKGLWDCFMKLDEIWIRELRNMQQITEVRQVLPLHLFIASNARFRVAIDLSFSTCMTDAWNATRSAIDSAVHANKIYKDPQLATVWSSKDDGKKETEQYRDHFERNKKKNLFSGLDELHRYYSLFSESGTHNTVTSIGLQHSMDTTAEYASWNLNYFETNPKRLGTFLFSLLRCFSKIEKVFSAVFRLDCSSMISSERCGRSSQ